METLKLQTNVPEIIALKYEIGRRVESQFGGQQVMFTLDRDRRIFLSPAAAATIERLSIPRDVPFQICKRESGSGKSRTVSYEVKRTEDLISSGPQSTPQAPRQTQTSNRSGVETQTAALMAQVVRTNQPEDSKEASGVREYTPAAKRFMSAFVSALDIATEVERYAERRQFALEFSTEDIRCLATTLFIQSEKEGQ